MIKKLYEAGCFDYRKFILTNIKKLSLNSNEAIILIKILDGFMNSKILSSEDIASSLAYPKNIVEDALLSLLDRNFYEQYINYDNGIGQEYISLDGFFNKVEGVLNNTLANIDDELFNANQYLTKQMNRILSSKDIEILTSLIKDDRYTLNDIENACNKLKSKNKLITMKNLAQAIVVKEEIKPNPTPSVVKDFFKSIK